MKKIEIQHYRVLADGTKSQVRKEIKKAEAALANGEEIPKDLRFVKSVKEVRENKAKLSPYGGITVARVEEVGGHSGAWAICGMKENFRRKAGRNIAEGRLKKMLQ